METPKIVKVTNKGMITIPADYRKKYHIKDGDQIVVLDDDEGIRLIQVKSIDEIREKSVSANKLLEIMEHARKRELELENWMKKKYVLDTGPITLYYAKNPPSEIRELFQKIRSHQIHGLVPTPVISEVYKHLCVANGKESAKIAVINLYNILELRIETLNQSLLIKAGQIKCRYPSKLSYIDCFGIALALLNKCEFHTTEKDLPNIYSLKVISYSF